jgi:citrate lyase beta subunit
MTLTPNLTRVVAERLRRANAAIAKQYPGDSPSRQPVHSFYGGAQLFQAETARKLGKLALQSLERHAGDAATLGGVLGLKPELAERIYPRILEKLRREPVEDYRIDFEDGYGNRPDAEEDGHAATTASEVAQAMSENILPPFIGIRIKPLTEELRERSLRTLDIFVTTLLQKTGGRLPENFVVTLPKITSPEQPAALADVFEILEPQLRLPDRILRMEFMVETTQSILNERGECALPALVAAARGRCTAAHFGTYDYTASCGITAAHQHMLHPACDFARNMMQVTLAGTGIRLSDGGTNILPVGDRATVHRAWKLHFDHIQHSLANGFYQGWDLHPAQLPTRYAAVFAFFLEGLDTAPSASAVSSRRPNKRRSPATFSTMPPLLRDCRITSHAQSTAAQPRAKK